MDGSTSGAVVAGGIFLLLVFVWLISRSNESEKESETVTTVPYSGLMVSPLVDQSFQGQSDLLGLVAPTACTFCPHRLAQAPLLPVSYPFVYNPPDPILPFTPEEILASTTLNMPSQSQFNDVELALLMAQLNQPKVEQREAWTSEALQAWLNRCDNC